MAKKIQKKSSKTMNANDKTNAANRIAKDNNTRQTSKKIEIKSMQKQSHTVGKSKEKIGFFTILSLMIGIMIGAGILVLPSTMSKFGSYGFWAWSVASVAVLNLAFIFSDLVRRNPDCSDPASFVGKYLSPKLGFIVSWWHWLGLTMGTALIAITLTSYFLALLGLSTKYSLYIAIAFIWGVLALQSLYTFISRNVLIALTVIKVTALLVIIFSGITHINWAALNISPAPGISQGYQGMLGALSIALFAFVGIESATLPGEEIENKNTTVPLALLVGGVLAAVIYTLTYSIVVSVLPLQQLWTTNTPVADTAFALMGVYGQRSVAVLAFLGCLGSLHGCLMGCAFLVKNSTRYSFVPKIFGELTRADFPLAGGALTATMTTILVLVYHLSPLSGQSTVRDALAYSEVFLVSLVYLHSVLAYYKSNGYKIPVIIGLGSCVLFIIGSRSIPALMPYQIACTLSGLVILNVLTYLE